VGEGESIETRWLNRNSDRSAKAIFKGAATTVITKLQKE
jgi:hypothetical protein